MSFSKKGDLSVNYLVLIALGIIVLIVVALIFYYGSSDFAEKIKNVMDEIWSLKPKLQ